MLRRRGRLERQLARNRPQPSHDYVSGLARRIGPEPTRRRSGWQPALAGGLTVLLVLAFALTGGIGYAASAVQSGTSAMATLVTGLPSAADSGNADTPKPNESSKPDEPGGAQGGGQSPSIVGGGAGDHKITICHYPPGNPDNPQTITIDESAWPAHEEHGDTLGPCEGPTPPDDQYEDKVLICHIPPGNPANRHTIRVSQNAVPAHLAHGDTLGPCPEDD